MSLPASLPKLPTPYLLLNGDDFPLAALLADPPPPEAILGRVQNQNWAGRRVAELWRTQHPNQAGKPLQRIVVRGPGPIQPGKFVGAGAVLFYQRGRERYRYLCGAYPHCVAPRPEMAYGCRLRDQKRSGPQWCAICRHRKGSDVQREVTIAMNKRRPNARSD